MWLINKSEGQERTAELDNQEKRASQALVAVIDVLLALILVEGAVSYRRVFATPSEANVPVVIALVLVYYTALRSFVDWHLAMEAMPYRILDDDRRGVRPRVRRAELLRVFLDFAIMASYSFLLLRAHSLIGHQNADLLPIAIAYPAIFVLYLIWGQLLRSAYQGQPGEDGRRFSRRLLFVAMVLAGAILAGYAVGRHDSWLSSERELNIALLGAELVLVFLFREVNWYQQVRLTGRSPAPIGGACPSVADELESLANLAEESAKAFRALRSKLGDQ
jgi:hypothetical protein